MIVNCREHQDVTFPVTILAHSNWELLVLALEIVFGEMYPQSCTSTYDAYISDRCVNCRPGSERISSIETSKKNCIVQALREFKKNIAAVKVDDLDIKLDNKSTAGGWEEVGLVGAEQQAPDQPVVKTEQGTDDQNADGESSESSLLPDHDICVCHT